MSGFTKILNIALILAISISLLSTFVYSAAAPPAPPPPPPPPPCISTNGQPCNCGTCGCGGTIQCYGECSQTWKYGQQCNCGACGCGGTIKLDGTCSGQNPTPSNYGQGCGCSTRYVTKCTGSGRSYSCTRSTVTSCSGTIKCDGTCSSGSYGQPCNCGPCGCGGTIKLDGTCSGANPTPSNYGQQCNCGPSGCGTIQCNGACVGKEPTPWNYGQACGNCGTIGCSWNCTNEGLCTPGQTQCLGSRYQICSQACQWQSGTDADNDGVDAQCGDSLCDNSPGVYDSTKAGTETSCTDGLDNDCDGLTDCNDNECDGSLTGEVKNQDNQLISSADVSAKKDLTTIKTATTNPQGVYTISPINCGTYNLVVLHPDYAPKTKANIIISPQQQAAINFSGSDSLVLGASCEQDCTTAADDIIHASCDGINSCTFYDSTAKSACDNSQPGWIRDYNESHYVSCASGAPQPKIEVEASVSCASGTLIKVTRIVVYNGKPVKLVVATCG